ncbi:MAG: hypothetical protein IJN81_01475, partial [Clostridia bacterium]|nr:hypothetical protein [Clostridia bacterium]
MFKRKKIKALLCILLALSVVFVPSVNISAQGLVFDEQGIYEEQLFENGECELGKFSIMSIIVFIRAEPNATSDTLFVSGVIFRIAKTILENIF